MPTKTTQKKPAPPPGPVADQGATLLVCIDDLYPSPTNPRKTFDDTALAELAGSIRSVGLLQPLVVRKLAVGYEVVAGERRFRAAKLAGLSYLPCSVLGAVLDVHVSRTDDAASENIRADQEKKARRKEEIRAHRVENAYRSRVWQALKGRLEVPSKGPESELVRLLAFALSTRGRSLAGTQVKHKGPRLRLMREQDAFAAWRKFQELDLDGVADTIIDAFAAFEVGYCDDLKPSDYGLQELANICRVNTYQLRVEAEAEFPKAKQVVPR